jgi:hypothetical protein
MSTLEEQYTALLQGIRRQGGTVQVYANIPLPLASALDLEPDETVTWKVVDGCVATFRVAGGWCERIAKW